ncbi:MAG: hypothetical protein VKL59_21575 [Nostocaceae cyanobacterium]|nr:hypothetical protein [Nostocaceae cyanobacterium]
MTDTPASPNPKWVIARNEHRRLQVIFVPELDTIVSPNEEFITIRRSQTCGRDSLNGEYVEALAVLVAPATDGLMIALGKKLWIKWRTPVEQATITESRLYTSLFGLPRGFQQFLPNKPSPCQLIRVEAYND